MDEVLQKRGRKSLTKLQIINNLLKDDFIEPRIWWNLSMSKFKKKEIEEIDRVFRKYHKRSLK